MTDQSEFPFPNFFVAWLNDSFLIGAVLVLGGWAVGIRTSSFDTLQAAVSEEEGALPSVASKRHCGATAGLYKRSRIRDPELPSRAN